MKSKAIDLAKNRIHIELINESGATEGPEDPRIQDFRSYVEQNAEYEVTEFAATSENLAKAQVKVKMISRGLRQVIIKIFSQQKTEGQSRNFNFEDSIPLILNEKSHLSKFDERVLNIDVSSKD